MLPALVQRKGKYSWEKRSIPDPQSSGHCTKELLNVRFLDSLLQQIILHIKTDQLIDVKGTVSNFRALSSVLIAPSSLLCVFCTLVCGRQNLDYLPSNVNTFKTGV